MLIDWSRGADRRDSKGAHVSHAPLPSRSSTELSQAAQLGEGTSLQRPAPLRDAFTLHPHYSSARLKKSRVLSDIRQTKLYKRINLGCNNFCPMLVIEFRGRPMANILRQASRSSQNHDEPDYTLGRDVFRPTRGCRKAHPI